MRSFRLLLLALVLTPMTAHSADVPVIYTVNSTTLKLAVSGTNLTFQLFTDAACTVPAHNQVIAVDNVSMLSVLKRLKPKNGVNPPKTTDIRATLTGVGAAAPLYLSVAGTGIAAVGGTCQVQAASTFGASPAGLVAKDANGTVLGPIDGGIVILSDGGTPVATFPQATGFTENSTFYYASANCTGPQLGIISTYGNLLGMAQQNGVVGTTLYYGPVNPPMTAYSSFDFAPQTIGSCTAPGTIFNPPDRCCCTSPVCVAPGVAPLGLPSSMDVSGFVPPFSVGFQ